MKGYKGSKVANVGRDRCSLKPKKAWLVDNDATLSL